MSRKPVPHPEPNQTDDPRFEPWLATMTLALVPAAAAVFMRSLAQMLLFGLTAAMLAAGLAMLVIQERRRARARTRHLVYPSRVVEGDPIDMEGAEP